MHRQPNIKPLEVGEFIAELNYQGKVKCLHEVGDVLIGSTGNVSYLTSRHELWHHKSDGPEEPGITCTVRPVNGEKASEALVQEHELKEIKRSCCTMINSATTLTMEDMKEIKATLRKIIDRVFTQP